ncbi:MAG: hydrogenase 3 maturation endopeptidase HyCI [Candidatus Hadarchaeales archaeon]
MTVSFDKSIRDLAEFVRGASRLAIVGVGSDIRGDDGAGVAVLRELRKKLGSGRALLVEGGVSPESVTGKLRKFSPSHVVLIDAADFGGVAGEIRVIEPDAISGVSVSTHAMSLSILSEYIVRELGSKVILIGIQPSHAGFKRRMSAEVSRSVSELATAVSRIIT